MNVRIRLFGTLRAHAPEESPPGRGAELSLREGTTVAGLLRLLRIDHLGEEGVVLAAVNDVAVDHETVLVDGDVVALFEPLAGG